MSRLSVIACMAAAIACMHAAGDELYQIIDLGDAPLIGGNPLCTGEGEETRIHALGVNNRGDVVGRVVCIDGPTTTHSRAFVWLSDRRFGLPANQIIFLNIDGGNDESAAWDINDAGIVVGWQGTASGPSHESSVAVYWDLSEANIPPHDDIPAPDVTGADPPFIAYGVNNLSPFQVVGVYRQEVGQTAFERGFIWTEGDDTVALNPVADDPEDWDISHALAVNDDTQGPLVGGLSIACGGAGGNCGVAATACDEAAGDATYWEPEDPAALASPGDGFGEAPYELEGEVQGVNNSGELVGASVECIGSQLAHRKKRAVYWVDTAAEPFNLGQLVIDFEGGAGEEDTQSIANGISETSPRVVAGWNSTDLYAVAWKADGQGGWDLIKLIDVIDPDIPIGTWTDLIEATDANVNGWIVGYGIIDPGAPDPPIVRGFLLIPMPAPNSCVGDTNDDGMVDVEDLVNVILDWDTDGSANGGDVDGSGTVDVGDLIAVVLNWGPCPGESGSVASLEDEVEGAGLDYPEDWDEFMDNIDDENYRCWMAHYLTSPCGPFCPEPPDCPGSNPF